MEANKKRTSKRFGVNEVNYVLVQIKRKDYEHLLRKLKLIRLKLIRFFRAAIVLLYEKHVVFPRKISSNEPLHELLL